MEELVIKRRSDEELLNIRKELNKLTFELEEQTNFSGNEEQLEMMQTFERAYIDGAPLVSDEEWDHLKHKFNYEESLVSTAPSGRKWRRLLSPLPSINKAASLEDLDDYFKKFDNDQKFKMELKLDGLTANISYKLNKERGKYEFLNISSRGNGRYGLILHPYALAGVKTNFPKEIDQHFIKNVINQYNDIFKDSINDLPEYFELRGEAVIPKNEYTFNKYGENAVWRSIASGMFNRKVPFNLEGVLQYIFETDKNFNEILEDNDGCIELTGAYGRLVASLSDDPEKFLKNDFVEIKEDFEGNQIVVIYHYRGGSIQDDLIHIHNSQDEYLDIVIYSCSINGNNVDLSSLQEIPGIKYMNNIRLSEVYLDKASLNSSNKNFYLETENKDLIKEYVSLFYGCDKDGKRDLNLPRYRNLLEYAMDGIVIKPIDSNNETQGMFFRNHKNNPNKIVCPKYPEDIIAVKLLSDIVKVKLEKIEFNETDLENITCSGILDKEYLTESGALVSKINLHNPRWLKENDWIKEGGEFYMIMSMDVIPVLLNPNLYD